MTDVREILTRPLAVLGVLLALALASGCGGGGASKPRAGVPGADIAQPSHDPLAYHAGRDAELERRAGAALSHVLYAKSPGGIAASVSRTERYRPQIQRAARGAGIEPDTLEAIVLLESAGRPDVIAGADVAAAAGLTQIVADTGTHLLGMHIDLAASRRLGRSLARARQRHQTARAAKLAAQRARVDQRFDPVAALAATVRYLTTARARFGRDDLAVESYHMGIGNLETAVRRYAGAGAGDPVAKLVKDKQLSYARLFFDSTPQNHPQAWSWLYSLGDDSATYLWRIGAARQILALARSDPAELQRQAQLQSARNSSEEVLHPPSSTAVFADPAALARARGAGQLVALPAAPLAADGIAIDPQMGQLARRVHQSPDLYRALRPEALALLGYLGAHVKAIAKGAPLAVTSSVRDARYQAVLAAGDIEATHGYSLHTTGYAFDLSRHYASAAQAQAVQATLDRLTALELIAWVREPTVIHVAVAGDAKTMLGA